MSGPFASAQDLEELTGLVVPRARAQTVLQAASDLIREECGQELSQVVGDVETLPGADLPTLILAERPVTAITSVLVAGSAVTDYTFSRWGVITRSSEIFWTDGAVVTYTHGFTEADWEFGVLRSVAIDIATRALSLNERGASEAMGSTLMESAGFSPEVFLTEGEKMRLSSFGKVLVG